MGCCGSVWVCENSELREFRLLTRVGISLFFAVRGIATDLRQVVDLTEIKHIEREDKIISEGTEDGKINFLLVARFKYSLTSLQLSS